MKKGLTFILFTVFVCLVNQAQGNNNVENTIVINEIMAMPEPVVSLPAYEYVELYNTTGFPVSLKDWTLKIGISKKIITNQCVIQPYSYLILCSDDAVAELSEYGECYGFSSFQVANGGTELNLFDYDNLLISNVKFTSSWYNDSEKSKGGWSLEQIDPLNPCLGRKNWSASVDKRGGTPGTLNSIDNVNITPIEIDYVSMVSENIIEVNFDRKMNPETLVDVDSYTVAETSMHPVLASIVLDKPEAVELVFDFDFEVNRQYTINIIGVESCNGTLVDKPLSAAFGTPDSIDIYDVVINEILFNPISPGVDYVELYNRSDKILDISELELGAIKHSFPNPNDTVFKTITSEKRLFFPHTYLLLSTDSAVVASQFHFSSENFLEMTSFPSYPNDDGCVVIRSVKGCIIDLVFYADDMHYPLLTETKGVALERISYDNLGLDADNWHSASESCHYGTPGYQNSMMLLQNINNDKITVTPEIFSPDGDGYNDVTAIHYEFDETGYTMNVQIFDSQGNFVRQLKDNCLVSQKGTLPWDGLDDSRNRASPGIYVIVIEVFDLNGNVKRYKNAVVVATK